MAWYRKTVCMAILTVSIPRNEKLKFETPPDTLAPGRFACNLQMIAVRYTG